MIIWRKIDPETGMFIEDVVLDVSPSLEDGTPDPAYIETPVPMDAGFWWPRWNGEAWEEGGTAPEPTEPEPTAIDEALAILRGEVTV